MARSLIASDDFNRAGPALGANWTQLHSDHDSIVIGGSDYIHDNTNVQSGTGSSARWAGTGTFANDQYSSMVLELIEDLADSNYHIGVIARASGDLNATRDFYFAAVCMNGGATKVTQIGRIVDGVRTQLFSAAVAWANGDRIEIECEGTSIRVCKNGTPLGGSFTVTDSALTSGIPGVCMGAYSGIRGDDWQGGDITAPGPSTPMFRGS